MELQNTFKPAAPHDCYHMQFYLCWVCMYSTAKMANYLAEMEPQQVVILIKMEEDAEGDILEQLSNC